MPPHLIAFVLMPFDPAFDDVYRLGIKATTEELGMIATRVDEQVFHKEGILERIYNQIDAADFIIADMTGKNPNVFYEVGYAHAKKKLCILLTETVSDIPFDLRHHRHIVYEKSITNLISKLKIDLNNIKIQIGSMQKPISVNLVKTDGLLLKSEYYVTARIDLYFDFHNYTDLSSPTIEAIYFYTGKGWKYKQDGQDCAQTEADVKGYSLRHMIRPPVSRLVKAGWAQVKIVGEKVLEFKWDVKEFKDSYPMAGRVLIKIVTEWDSYEYPLSIDTEIVEFPF